MSYHDILFSANIPWMRNRADLVVPLIDEHFSPAGRTIEWRADRVSDFRSRDGPASAERLIRWDTRHPDVIFTEGFMPQVVPSEADIADLPREALDVAAYVANNVDSIFVSTARYYRIDQRNVRWTLRNLANLFEYEIFAHGGIDVNLSLGSSHRHWNQREVVFPGGIRPEHIRTARQYDARGRVVALWATGGFDLSSLPDELRARLVELPHPVCGVFLRVIIWTGDDRRQNIRLVSSSAVDAGSDDAMRSDGVFMPDDDMIGEESLQNWKPARNCLLSESPGTSLRAWFFADTRVAKIDVQPGSVNDTVVEGPSPIMDVWPALRQAGFGRVNASWPKLDNPRHVYFFSDTQYILIDIHPPQSIITGPSNILDDWPALRKAGFSSLDAALPVGDNNVHVFKGEMYAVIGRLPEADAIAGPYRITDKWDGLRQANFTTIDAVLWGRGRSVYYFSGSQYVIINIDTTALEAGPKSVAGNWPSLVDANFY